MYKRQVFDKTGTLTYASPVVAQVIPFGSNSETEMLRLAACLEEHFPHSMANAVVSAAQQRGLSHEELHSQVQYLVCLLYTSLPAPLSLFGKNGIMIRTDQAAFAASLSACRKKQKKG